MSNVLFKDGVYNGVIIKTTKIKGKTRAENRIIALCGESIGAIIAYMARFDMGGLEGLAGIPGSLGGIVRQNAGAFGYELKDRFVSARCYLPESDATVELSFSDMCFAYRESILQRNGAILLSATLDFIPKSRDEIFREIKAYREKRVLAQPLTYPSLGSVFKQHKGVSAGYYIDRAGLKGLSVGGARVSEKHAGFIINNGGATADDYLRLIDLVKREVYAKFSVELREEIEII